MTKQAEIDYVQNTGGINRVELNEKPFQQNPSETARLLRILAGIIELLNLPAGSSILDLGCGPGWTSVYLAHQGYDVLGFDIAPDMIRIARQRAAREGVSERCRFAVADSEAFDFGEQFDAVVVYDTLHHVQQEEAVLANCYRHLNPGGKLVLCEPGWLHARRERHVTADLGVTERGFLTRQLTGALRRAGFTDIRRFVPAHHTFTSSVWQAVRTSVMDLAYYLLFAGTHLQIWLVAMKPVTRQKDP